MAPAGNFIVDAAGKLNDVSKSAFDAFGISHGGRFDPGFGELVKKSFSEGVKSLLSKAGLSGEQLETWGSSGWQETVKEFAGAVSSEAVAMATGAAVGGPAGAALGMAMEAGQLLHNLFERTNTFGAGDVSYQSGQWIAIDNGLSSMTKNMRNVLDDEWDVHNRRLLGAGVNYGPDIHEGEGVEFRDALSVGFVVGPGETEDTVLVFNLLKARDETKRTEDVRPLDQGYAAKMDSNEIWSEVRLLRFETDPASMLDSDVCTDPGAEVLHDNETFFVLTSLGDKVKIEHKRTGAQHWVSLDTLSPGQRYHTNSWNYQADGVPDGFGNDEATLCTGDYIWIRPEPDVQTEFPEVERQLCCIYMLDGHVVRGYMALDGAAIYINMDDKSLVPVSDTLNSYLNQSKVFNSFKDAAVCGRDVSRLAAGRHSEVTLLCLGITPLDEHSEKKDWRVKSERWISREHEKRAVARLYLRNAGQAGDAGLKESLDVAEEAMNESNNGPTAGNTQAAAVAEVIKEPIKSGSGGMVMLGLAGAGAALFFLR